ncbi:VapE domain-containing protein [Bradyrhizobium sp. 613_E4_N2_2]|uniref:VapE domain-containing protein n=1 Tax=Bradyrhizobium sp. 613_E4_N2_2 TaxID=3240371 RepID=UPI003F890B2B
MSQIDFDIINRSLDAESVVPQWVPNGKRQGREWSATNPNRADRSPGSFSVNLVTGKWADFASGDKGGDLVSLYAYLKCNGDNGRAARELMEQYSITVDATSRERVANDNVRQLPDDKPVPIIPVPDDVPAPTDRDFKHFKFGEPSRVWAYRDAEGRVLMYVCRFDPEGMRKQVVPLAWCHDPKRESNRWAWRGITKGKNPLYGLERLAAAPDADVVLVEGEKAADAANVLLAPTGAVAVTWMGGVERAGNVSLKALAGRRVILWPDFDHAPGVPMYEQPGVRAMMALASDLKGVASSVTLVGYRFDQFEHGWDLADAEADGWDTDRVVRYMADHSGDPAHIASGNAFSETRNVVPLDAVVSPFGFPHVTDKGGPLSTIENLQYILGQYDITVRYNVISKDLEININGMKFSQDNTAQNMLTSVGSLCSRNRMPKGDLQDYLLVVADTNERNPAAEWIDSRPWDGVDRIGALVDTLDPIDRDLAYTLVRRWMIGAAGCAFEPNGMSMQGVLVLQGPQYSGKTTWFWSLTNGNRRLAKEGATLNPADRDSVKQAVSYWLVELGELDATFRKSDVAALKAFLTKDQDELRLPFAKTASKYPRRTAFFASVNPKQYLHDDTGNRRYWTIPHGPNLRGIHDVDIQQAWAQAKHLWKSGEQHRLTQEEMDKLNAANADHAEGSAIEELILSSFVWEAQDDAFRRPMSATAVLLAIGQDRPNNKLSRECGAILRRLVGEPKKHGGLSVYPMPRLKVSENHYSGGPFG